MREVITLSIGGSGINFGSLMWELFCVEHKLNQCGEMLQQNNNDCIQTCFRETIQNKYTPRSVFADLGCDQCDEVRCGNYYKLYDPTCIVSGKEEAEIFSRGNRTAGKEQIDIVLDRIRRVADYCTGLQGVLLLHSTGGGTGSGFLSLLLDRIQVDYGRKSLFTFTVLPEPNLSSVIMPYNHVLSMSSMLMEAECCFMFSNKALRQKSLNSADDSRNYKNINHIVVQALANITASMRFDGSLFCDMTDITVSLIPYPRIHFISIGMGPIISAQMIQSLQIEKKELPLFNTVDIGMDTFKASSNLTGCNFHCGKFMAASMLFRGDIVPRDVSCICGSVKTKRTIQFVDWCPTGFKMGINYDPPGQLTGSEFYSTNKSICTIANHTGINDVLLEYNYDYDILYSKRSFLHWYLNDGMEEDDFTQARDQLVDLELEYDEIANEIHSENSSDDCNNIHKYDDGYSYYDAHYNKKTLRP